MVDTSASSEFELYRINAAVEKLDLTVKVVFGSKSVSGVYSALLALIELISKDPVLRFIDSLITKEVNCDVDSWLKKYAVRRGSIRGSGVFELGRTVPERYCIIKQLLQKVTSGDVRVFEESIIKIYMTWYNGNFSEILKDFLQDFIGALYRDLRNSLVDLRVNAKLSSAKKISSQQIINIVFSGNVQNVQTGEIVDSEITQTE